MTDAATEAVPGSESYSVELYCYDLSGGLARQLSAGLLGRHFEAVYHTSIVIHFSPAIEVFFGQGISVCNPGGSHHGAPMEVIPLGNTQVDQDTWAVILEDLKERYTPQAYNLMTFNCNTFSNEVSQILVDTDIPAHITSLPTDFQAALSNMMGGASRPGMGGAAGGGNPLLGALTQQMNQRATNSTPYGNVAQGSSAPVSAPSAPPTQNLFNITTQQELDKILASWPCAAVLFTNTATCPPCKVIHPVFENLARQYAPPAPSVPFQRIAFIVIDSSPASMGMMRSYGIRGTPTFKFFVKGKQRGEFSGADAAELRSQVNVTLFDVYKAHPHAQLRPPLGSLKNLPRKPVVFASVPNLRSALRVLDETLATVKAPSFAAKADMQEARRVIANEVVPWLEGNFASTSASPANGVQKAAAQAVKRVPLPAATAAAWQKASQTLLSTVPSKSLFPLVDMLRLAVNDGEAASVLAAKGMIAETVTVLSETLSSSGFEASTTMTEGSTHPLRSTWLTTLRLLCNILSSPSARTSLTSSSATLSLITTGLLQSDKSIRATSASAAFDLSLWRSSGRASFLERDAVNSSSSTVADSDLPGDWASTDVDTEMISATIECIRQETESAETLHQLFASLMHVLYLSRDWADLTSLCEVLGGSEAVGEKVSSGSPGGLVARADKKGDIEGLAKDLQKIFAVTAEE